MHVGISAEKSHPRCADTSIWYVAKTADKPIKGLRPEQSDERCLSKGGVRLEVRSEFDTVYHTIAMPGFPFQPNQYICRQKINLELLPSIAFVNAALTLSKC